MPASVQSALLRQIAQSPWLKKPLLAWILYDVASSSYALLIPGVIFAVYYRQAVCGGTPACDAHWALLVSFALLATGLLSPLLGAIADLGAVRHRLFILTTLLCCAATAGLYWVQPGQLVWGGLMFWLAHTGYNLAAGLYDAYLPGLVPTRLVGRLSGLGWGLGYLGGLACFFLSLPLTRGGLAAENLPILRLTFLLVSSFYFVVALPALVWLPRQLEPGNTQMSVTPGQLIRQAYQQVWRTFRNWKQQREVFKFLLSYYLISDAVVTVLSFVSIFISTQFGYSLFQILQLTLLFNLMAVPATIVFGFLSAIYSAKSLIQVTLGIWVGMIGLMAFSSHPVTPILIACLLGVVAGSTQSLCRSLFATLIPASRATEMFGFNNLVGRVSAIAGPLTFGFISSVTGNQRLAMLFLLLFFGLGSYLLAQVMVQPRQPDPLSANP